VMIIKSGEVSPSHVATQDFDGAGFEHEPEQQPAQKPQHDARRRRDVFEARKELKRRKEDRQKAGLEQQNVPLEGEKFLADGGKRQVNQPEQEKNRRGSNAG